MPTPEPIAAKTEVRAILVSLGVGIALLVIKFTAYLMTGSAAIFSDALESIVNVLASTVALYAIVLAHTPADPEHPYGHGKIEFLAAGFEGGMMLLAVLVIVFRAVEAIIRGPRIEQVDIGLVLIFSAMMINGAVGGFLVHRARRFGSMVLEADGKHLLADAVTSAGVILALLIVRWTGWVYADPIAAILVAIYIVWVSAGLLQRSVAGLMDRQDARDEQLLRQILDRHTGADAAEPCICSYHKLRHRHSGRYHWVDFHIVVPSAWDIRRGHEVASAIEYEIEQALGEANATAHVEPCADGGCAHCHRG